MEKNLTLSFEDIETNFGELLLLPSKDFCFILFFGIIIDGSCVMKYVLLLLINFANIDFV